MSPVPQALIGFAVLSVVMTLVWLSQRRTGNAGTVDVAWTLGVGLLGVFYATTSPGSPIARVLVGAISGAWSLRLGMYLAQRVIGKEEDGRYRTLRATWGARTQPYMLAFFQLQALLAVILAVSFQVAARNPRLELGAWAFTSVLIAVLSIGGETLADRQLASFRADPANRGRTCRVGLWRYSRHPNYFFEWLHWWAYVPLAIGAPWAPITVAAPRIMLFLLFRVTGIPATEQQAALSRGDDYRDYQRTTSAFFPWFPKTEVSRCS